MKKIVILVSLLLVITLGAYGVCGFLARKNFEAAVAHLQTNFPGPINYTYEQGLFSADLDMEIHIPIPNSSAVTSETVTARLRQTVHHGPFVLPGQAAVNGPIGPVQVYGHGRLEFEPFMAEETPLIRQLRRLATTRITVTVPLFGRAGVAFTSQSQQASLEMGDENLTLTWQGFAGDLSVDTADLQTYDLDFQAPGLVLTGNNAAALAVKNVTARARMQKGSHNLSLGTMTTSMQNMTASAGPQVNDKVSLHDLIIRITTSEEKNLLRLEEEIDVARLQIADRDYGPANLKISLNNLDAAGVADLAEAYYILQANPVDSQVPAATGLSRYATSLLAQSPQIRLENFSLTSPDGSCRATAHIAFNGEGNIILNPFFLLGRLSAAAAFSADRDFVEALARSIMIKQRCGPAPHEERCTDEATSAALYRLQGLRKEKILLLNSDTYSLSASFKDGQAILNDEPIPLRF